MATQYQAVGRRKTSVARVYLRPGTGNVVVNKRPLAEYLPTAIRQASATAPLDLTELRGQFDVLVNAKGGGLTGQAEAIQLGIARALVRVNPEFRGALKAHGFLTRDAREVERKKYGRKGARARFQFSKR